MSVNIEDYIDERLGEGKEFTPKQLSYAFGVHISTIYRHIQEGKLEAYKIFGYKIDRQSIKDWGAQSFRF